MQTNYPEIDSATYSAEDNKLRIYTNDRISDELYGELKELGFKWAPMQKFYGAAWNTKREDMAIALAGSIEPEGTTMAERAEIKAQRLIEMTEKKIQRASGYAEAAQTIAAKMSHQPILAGHHSQRKAEKMKDTAERSEAKAKEMESNIQYWKWKISGVIHHANKKADSYTRHNRIKTLLADLRKHQRSLNDDEFRLSLWVRLDKKRDSETINASVLQVCNLYKYSIEGSWGKLNDGEWTTDHAIDVNLKAAQKIADSNFHYRWINHILNRLSYEQSFFAETSKFEGQLTAPILQTFCRTHGAEKPTAKATEGGKWKVTSVQSLPIQIGDGKSLELLASEWVDLMASLDYTVPAPPPKKAPIVNPCAELFSHAGVRGYGGKLEMMEIVEMTKAEYAQQRGEIRGTRDSYCGEVRVKVTIDNREAAKKIEWYARPWVVVSLTDSKKHKIESISFIKQGEYVAGEETA